MSGASGRGGPGPAEHAGLAARALSAAAAHADHGPAAARHRRARRAVHPDRALRPLGRQPGPGSRGRRFGYGLGILVPLAALWLGTSVIGDLVEDRLLVYLRLKPVARWQLPAAAVLATASVVVPLTALPLAASALVAGAGDVALAALLASSLAAIAYSGLFVAAGLWFPRAVWWGLAFVLIWENVIAYSAEGAARFTVIGWASAVLGLAPDVDVELAAGPAAPRSSFSPRSRSQAGWSRRGATAAPTSTDVRASAAGRRPGTARRRTS